MHAGIGDAWGVCFEYAPRKVIDERINDWAYFDHHKYNIGGGRYSDDLQMHIAVAEVLTGGDYHDPMAYTEAFVNAFKRDPREGYAGRFYVFLQGVEDAEDFSKRIINNSEKSGAAMRAGCIGLFSDVDELMEVCRIQAAVTHDTPLGIGAAQAAALMVHYGVYGKGDRSDLPEYLNSVVPVVDWADLPKKKIGHLGVDSVKAALRAVVDGSRMTEILRSVVALGGDTDTAATVAMAAAHCFVDVEQDLPDVLFDGFEDGAFGREYVMELDEKLRAFAEGQGGVTDQR